MLHKEKAYVLDVSYTILQDVDWTQAMTLVSTNKAWILRGFEDSLIHSQYLTYQQPKWVVLYKYSNREYKTYNSDRTSFGTIMKRDKERCIYCNKHADTIDHIIPKSKSGLDVVNNLAACCWNCNQKKRDRTPEEAGMKLLWTPGHVDFYAKEQKAIYRYLENMTDDQYFELYG